MFRAIADGVLAVVLAPACLSCDTPLDAPTRGPVCDRCWSAIVPFTPPLCTRCGDPLPSWRVISVEAAVCPRCRRRPSALSSLRAIGGYEGPLRAILHALKYRGRRSVSSPLAALMLRECADALHEADMLVPVPLHWRKRRARGFNQAEELARRLPLPVLRALRRTRATPSQTDLPAARRHANVRGAFRVRRRANVGGRRIVLIDDVCTTGATLEACARVLREAGAADVRALTAARVAARPRE
jgi:ComF family protein